MNYDLIVVGSGPGGYVAAIRASQLGLKTAVIEKAELGGICLNWGCIPTKSLLKSAQVFDYVKHASDYGVIVEGTVKPDFGGIIGRSRSVAEGMSKGVQFLLKKNKIEVIQGSGKLAGSGKVTVTDNSGVETVYEARNIILATGARSKELPNLKQDGKKIIGYRDALALEKLPVSMVVVGSGAIGTELASFYNSMGTDVTLVEFLPEIVPLEDEEVSKALARSLKKAGIKIITESSVESIEIKGEICLVSIKTKKGIEIKEAEIVLSAVGVTPNLENLGLESAGVLIENGKIKVGKFPFTASGKASAAGEKDGFVKLIFDSKHGELLGAHLIGSN
ncbi:MAG: FAD-dependent oxidoreductase, partial [Bacteroidales bacterium]